MLKKIILFSSLFLCCVLSLSAKRGTVQIASTDSVIYVDERESLIIQLYMTGWKWFAHQVDAIDNEYHVVEMQHKVDSICQQINPYSDFENNLSSILEIQNRIALAITYSKAKELEQKIESSTIADEEKKKQIEKLWEPLHEAIYYLGVYERIKRPANLAYAMAISDETYAQFLNITNTLYAQEHNNTLFNMMYIFKTTTFQKRYCKDYLFSQESGLTPEEAFRCAFILESIPFFSIFTNMALYFLPNEKDSFVSYSDKIGEWFDQYNNPISYAIQGKTKIPVLSRDEWLDYLLEATKKKMELLNVSTQTLKNYLDSTNKE